MSGSLILIAVANIVLMHKVNNRHYCVKMKYLTRAKCSNISTN